LRWDDKEHKKMKQIWPNYSYSPATNVLTLTGLNIDRDQLLLVTAADRGRIMYNFADSSVTASAFTSGANTALTLVATTAGLTTTAALIIYYDDQLQSTSVSISNFPSTQTIAGTVTIGSSLPAGTSRIGVVTIGGGTVTIGAGTAQIGSVTVGNSVTISSLPENLYITIKDGINNYVQNDGPLPVSGNVGLEAGSNTIGNVGLVAGSEAIGSVSVSNISSLPDAGDNAVIRTFMFGYDYAGDVPVAIAANGTAISVAGSVTASISNSVTIASLPSISGTVTANSPNGSLTTRFGSVTTANTAFATSAVTNSNRKYLLIQNITTASNVITVGIGFTPTTTQGIQLFSGAGLTFDGSYIPTGAVNLLSSVTASCYTILEA